VGFQGSSTSGTFELGEALWPNKNYSFVMLRVVEIKDLEKSSIALGT